MSNSVADVSVDWPGRWNHILKLITRGGPFARPDFVPNPEILPFILENCNILVIGAGGLGCELLKDLALSGFRNVDVIDMDTIDVSNLNRQFLYRPKDVGRPKAEVAAEFINQRIHACNVVPYYARIEDYDESFYKKYSIVVSGLDSVVARRWINGMLLSLLEYDESGAVVPTSVVPFVDGGTEGFKGNARVILPGITACLECTVDLFPPQVNFPLCTIAHTPRLPEHCIEYARILLWPQEKPFGDDVGVDGDDPNHIQWIMDRAVERAQKYNIQGITFRLTQGVVKRIIPAVASTNATIAAACANEVFKLATSCSGMLSNYMVYNDTDGMYTYTFEAEKRDDCVACSLKPQTLSFNEHDKLKDIINYLKETAHLQMKSPGITAIINGRNKTLYLSNIPAIEEKTRPNLNLTLTELGITSQQEIVVVDKTTPKSLIFRINLATAMDQ